MEEIEYLKSNKIEIQVKRFDDGVYIHYESVIDLLKGYKQQLTLTSVVRQSEQLVCDNCDNTLCEEELGEGICFNCDTQV